mmetsp:Transcript_78522/g.91821  ORF Transcript_78522/g.91821 Transcript_78522/m.91821 type:complete len:108 (-) Transcript_78522:207-530(-)
MRSRGAFVYTVWCSPIILLISPLSLSLSLSLSTRQQWSCNSKRGNVFYAAEMKDDQTKKNNKKASSNDHELRADVWETKNASCGSSNDAPQPPLSVASSFLLDCSFL